MGIINAESFQLGCGYCFVSSDLEAVLLAFVSGKDMLMKGAGRDCTALFSILTLVFRKIVLWYSLEHFVSAVAVSLAWKDPMSSYSRSIAFRKLRYRCVGNVRLDLTQGCGRQVSCMGKRRVSDGEVHGGRFGRPSNMILVLSFL